MVFGVVGARIRVRLDDTIDDRARSEWTAIWRDCILADSGSADLGYDSELTVGLGGPRHAADYITAHDVQQLAIAVLRRVAAMSVGRAKHSTLVLTGCTVSTDDGRAIVFMGGNAEHRSEIARQLCAHYGYVGATQVGIADDLTLEPFVSPLSVTDRQGERRLMAASRLGLTVAPVSRLTLSALVVLDHDTDAPRAASVTTLGLAEAIELIVPHTNSIYNLAQPLHRMAIAAGITGGIRQVTYRDASRLSDVVPRMLEGRTLRPEPWSGYPAPTRRSDYCWAEVTDAIDVAGTPLILQNRVVHALGGVGPAVWMRAHSGATLEELVDTAIEWHGEPAHGDARELVATAVADLVRRGILARGT